MKIYVRVVLMALLFLPFTGMAQFAVEWQRSFGGTNQEVLADIAIDTDMSIIAVGYARSSNGDVVGNHGGDDFWVIKLDSAGNLFWKNCFGGSGTDLALSVEILPDGNYLIVGWSLSSDGDVSNNHGSWDYWIIKIDPSGNLLWQKTLGGSSLDCAQSIKITPDGGCIVLGWTHSTDGDVTGSIGGGDFWLVKLDSAGNIQWENSYGGTGFEESYSMSLCSDGGFLMTGRSDSNNGNVSGNHGDLDMWVLKTDSAGVMLWQRSIGGSLRDEGFSIVETSDGGSLVCGFTQSNDGDVSGFNGISDALIIKLDGFGNIQWQKCLGTPGAEIAYCGIEAADGGFLITGNINVNSAGGIMTAGYHGSGDAWLVKLDANGLFEWQRCIGGTEGDNGYVTTHFSGKEYVVGGYKVSGDGDFNVNIGQFDFYILKGQTAYNTISGKLFSDSNLNNQQDSSEFPILNHLVSELSNSTFSYSQSEGKYYITYLDTASTTIIPDLLNYHDFNPNSHIAAFTGFDQIDSLNNFAFQPAGTFNDLCISLTPLGNFRSGMPASYMISYSNVGTTTLNPTVIFYSDADVTFQNATPSPSSVASDSVVWSFGLLAPFQSGNILVTVIVDSGVPIGTLINSGAVIEPVANDANTICNQSYWELLTTGSIDPNDILVSRDTLYNFELVSPPYLEYLIRFQNTGNDTAFYVRVGNNITTDLDLTSFEVVASSHPMDLEYSAHSRLMEFTFNNILLPDSGINEPESHGFIRYRIKPLNSLVVGDSIQNRADIYFDFNAPVATNTVVTEIVLPLGIDQPSSVTGHRLAVYPNPFRDEITIELSGLEGQSVTVGIYDICGRLVGRIFGGRVTRDKLQVTRDLDRLSGGIYFVRIQSGIGSQNLKIVKY